MHLFMITSHLYPHTPCRWVVPSCRVQTKGVLNLLLSSPAANIVVKQCSCLPAAAICCVIRSSFTSLLDKGQPMMTYFSAPLPSTPVSPHKRCAAISGTYLASG